MREGPCKGLFFRYLAAFLLAAIPLMI